ncbi:hypothetical protein N7509_012056 [Penicillium cosmopolitanum]|uniref:Uncharacterized protein n=1 Tax=Penicillium cosmopolitanum TaxID=1131564 RepID=A0A9W9SIA0_9EURO|nr:uncharacterized protein N7509_012056 [Penicillium cosmopolitanum]KAJ5378937.1 hypothetical protein N7509_012056 [Penicillium cosmopolitanum]
MMRCYFTVNSNDDTLAGYRWGVMRVNRCMAALLANGWGHKSWEIFLLAQFARFAAFEMRSYQRILEHLGNAGVPIKEEG